ncbi:SRPBCC family protein [Pedobacter mucosus]|uniref:SRPBCC family protein n=1 Tax=Pedobacter mucosus TaxID=2895286 RepID=UPI001EE448DA|nr:SRPBCC family protein [Pedobacter mucosus]UKT64562.1 SRPBCC family protein [Pedobacter mucosus]
MKFIKILIGIIVVLAVIIVIGGLFLPKTYSVNRSTTIYAPDSVIYKNIVNFNEFYKWNPWAKMDPSAKTAITGPIGKPGHIYEWKGKESGAGQMKIITIEPNKEVDIDLLFKEPFEDLADTKFDIQPETTGNKVTWTMSGNHNLISKWMCVFVSMDKMIGKDFESGLASLKKKSEEAK